jgi:hypothetical protein
MKKLTTIVFVIVFTFSLAACGGVSQEEYDSLQEQLNVLQEELNALRNSDIPADEPELEITAIVDLYETASDCKWVKGVHIDEAFEPPNYFLHYIPYDVLVKYIPLMEYLAEGGVGGMANHIGVYCVFYRTGENSGFTIRRFGHTMGAHSGVYDMGYIDNTGYRTIHLGEGTFFGLGLTDGEFLYYMLDGILHRLSKDGEIKTYLVFGEDDDKFLKGHHFLEGDGDEITVNPHYHLSQSVVVNINVFD